MDTTLLLIIGGGLGLLLIMGAGAALLLGGSRVNVDERIEQFTGINPEWVEIAEESPQSQLHTADVADRLDKAISKQGFNFFNRTKSLLSQADIKLRVSEYYGLVIVFIFLGAILGYYFLGGMLGIVVGGLVGTQPLRIYVNFTAKKRMRTFDNQLSDTLNLWVNALRSGFSVMQGMEAIATELPAPVSKEFERIIQEIRLGLDMESALANSLNRIPSEDYDLVITAVNIQREVGGNLAEILDIISFTIRERVRIKGEIRTLTAQGRATGWVITLLPIGLGLAMYAINPDYLLELFVNEEPYVLPDILSCGWLMIGVALMMMGAGAFAIQKIVDIEV